MTVGSLIPAFIDALYAQLSAAQWPAGVAVLEDVFDLQSADALVIGDTFQENGVTDRQWRSFGSGPMTLDERFVVNVVALVAGKRTARDARVDLFAIFDVFQYVLRESAAGGGRVTFGIRGVNSTLVRQPEHLITYDQTAGYGGRLFTGVQVATSLRAV